MFEMTVFLHTDPTLAVTQMRRIHHSAYRHRQRVMQSIVENQLKSFSGLSLTEKRFQRRRLQSTSGAKFDFDSNAFIAAIGNASGLQEWFGQTSLEVLQLASAASIPVESSPYSSILAGNCFECICLLFLCFDCITGVAL